ncbi:MAG: transcriptional regulator [Clostridia bacterium]|nr:transcriptional regulator [Clostridia bacterium]MDE7328561.1 transcriptional regulator [Clostridia bacterium]
MTNLTKDKLKQKLKLLKLYEILEKESDESRPLSTYDLIDRLAVEGISVTRKTLYEDIQLLIDDGYEIVQLRGKCNTYYVERRRFDVAEVRILMDAVEASSFISPKKTALLVDKIADLAGSLRGEVIKKNIAIFDTVKRDNDRLYDNVFNINEAIIEKKKISFTYFKLDAKGNKVPTRAQKPYVVDPLATVVSNDNYYLVCYNEKYDSVSHFRIDRMDVVTLSNKDISLPERLKNFDVGKKRKELFSMFLGAAKSVTFEITKDLVEVVLDKFGPSTAFSPYGENYRFTAEVQISDMFFGWCCALGEKLKIISPKDVRDGFVAKMKRISQSYAD